MKYVAATIAETAFNCPHCHVLTSQRWHRTYCRTIDSGDKKPRLISSGDSIDWSQFKEDRERRKFEKFIEKAVQGTPLLNTEHTDLYAHQFINVHVSECFECGKCSIWLRDRQVYPEIAAGPLANLDTPEHIKADYDEASAILQRSPRGAAALLRLCIQKLCKHLGQPGRNINDDIGALVAAGLDPRVQKALDAVRVIGNNAVHPGQIDLQDDNAIAESLFSLFNLIVDKMISEPKMVDEVYAKLPPGVLAQIEQRDKPKP